MKTFQEHGGHTRLATDRSLEHSVAEMDVVREGSREAVHVFDVENEAIAARREHSAHRDGCVRDVLADNDMHGRNALDRFVLPNVRIRKGQLQSGSKEGVEFPTAIEVLLIPGQLMQKVEITRE